MILILDTLSIHFCSQKVGKEMSIEGVFVLYTIIIGSKNQRRWSLIWWHINIWQHKLNTVTHTHWYSNALYTT